MRIVHLSDIHVWKYSWDPRRILGRRSFGMIELLMGRARRFQLNRLAGVVDRVLALDPDHILITGDLTTTALPAEFAEATRQLAPLLTDATRTTILPGNHDRATGRAMRSHRFEGTFGAFMPSATFPWMRYLDAETAILGIDPTRTHFSPRGLLPAAQLEAARSLTADPSKRPRVLMVACHYPAVAPAAYAQELVFKRMKNDHEVIEWLAGIGPHIYCCGHVHAAWAIQPPTLPNELCLNAGAPLMRDPTGLRLPGFLEIQLEGEAVTVLHHAWSGTNWCVVPFLRDIRLSTLQNTATPVVAAPA